MERRFPRREAIGLGLSLLGGAVVYNAFSGNEIRVTRGPQAALTPEIVALLRETIEYRSALGLPGYSDEVPMALRAANSRWQTEAGPFQNRFPPYLYSYGELTHFLSDVVFTAEMAPYVIKGAEINRDSPYQYAFGMDTRLLNFAHNAGLHYWTTYDPLGNSALGFFAHEAPGHGLDTLGLAATTPLDTFARLEHGKWRMQSQMLQVSGPLTEGPAWSPNRSIAYDLGLAAGKRFVENQSGASANPDTVKRIVSGFAQVQNTKPDDVRFNKEVCTVFGRRLLRENERGTINLDDDLQREHTKGLVKTLPETFAEMMMGSLINPDLVNNNPEILAGAQEVLSAIRGDAVPLEVIRRQMIRIPRSIEDLRKAEIAKYSSAPPPVSERIMMADPKDQKIERVFARVIEVGSFGIPGDFKMVPWEKDLFANYLNAVAAVCSHYPELTNLVEKPRSSFDPKRNHAWNTQKVEEAIRPGRIRQYIEAGYDPDPTVLRFHSTLKAEIAAGLQVLDAFLHSDAFGS